MGGVSSVNVNARSFRTFRFFLGNMRHCDFFNMSRKKKGEAAEEAAFDFYTCEELACFVSVQMKNRDVAQE